MIRKVLLAAALLAANCVAHAGAILSEDFDNIATLGGSGWSQINKSTPGGSTAWFQGDLATLEPAAHDSFHPSFIGANFLNAPDAGGNISNWLLTPTLVLNVGESLTFYTRSNGAFPDRLEVRMSTNGASANVGATDSSVGDFTTLLASINPTLSPGGYPADWVQYSIVLAGFDSGSLGRLAFRYFITDTAALNGDSIGIDTVRVTVPEPATIALFALALVGLLGLRIGSRRSGTLRVALK